MARATSFPGFSSICPCGGRSLETRLHGRRRAQKCAETGREDSQERPFQRLFQDHYKTSRRKNSFPPVNKLFRITVFKKGKPEKIRTGAPVRISKSSETKNTYVLKAREFFLLYYQIFFTLPRDDRLDTPAYMTSIVFDMCLVCLI